MKVGPIVERTLMTTPEFHADVSSSHILRKRFLFVAVVIALVLVATTFTSSTNAQSRFAKQKASAAGLKGAVPNPTPNPAFTYGEKCSLKIAVMVDRSGSVGPEESTYKNTIKGFYDILNARAKAPGMPAGSQASVYLSAYATYAVSQNLRPPSSTMSMAQWLKSIDVADDTNLAAQKTIVDDIWFEVEHSIPYDPGQPQSAYKGYYGSGNLFDAGKFVDGSPLRNSAAGGSHTNYDAALTLAANQINFSTAGNADWRGDDDFDMVLMITDGLPTQNFGKNHKPDFEEPDLTSVTPDSYDVDNAKEAVNTLRTGDAVKDDTGEEVTGSYFGARPPVSVIGVLVGPSSGSTLTQDNMTTIFGNEGESWFKAPNFDNNLRDALSAALGKIGCKPTSFTTVHPDLEISVNSGPSVDQGQETYIDITIKNTGEVPMGNVELQTYGPYDVSTPSPGGGDTYTSKPFAGQLDPGDSFTYRQNFNTGYDRTNFFFAYRALGSGIIDEASQICDSDTSEGDDPCSVRKAAHAGIVIGPTALPS